MKMILFWSEGAEGGQMYLTACVFILHLDLVEGIRTFGSMGQGNKLKAFRLALLSKIVLHKLLKD